MGQPRPIFVLFIQFTVDFSEIRTCTDRVESRHADHLTTNPAQKWPSCYVVGIRTHSPLITSFLPTPLDQGSQQDRTIQIHNYDYLNLGASSGGTRRPIGPSGPRVSRLGRPASTRPKMGLESWSVRKPELLSSFRCGDYLLSLSLL